MKHDSGTALIPRRVLYGNSERGIPTVSHDGRHLAFLAPVDGVMNVWVAPVNAMDEATAVTTDTERGITFYLWAYNSKYILHLMDKGGDENWRRWNLRRSRRGMD